MIRETIDKIEARIQKADSVTTENKEELLNLISTLKAEIDDLSKAHNEQAESITGFAALSIREATRQEKNPELVKLSLKGLRSSIQEFEATNSKLVETVNAICVMLQNIGI
jgi:hypothetical protein